MTDLPLEGGGLIGTEHGALKPNRAQQRPIRRAKIVGRKGDCRNSMATSPACAADDRLQLGADARRRKSHSLAAPSCQALHEKSTSAVALVRQLGS